MHCKYILDSLLLGLKMNMTPEQAAAHEAWLADMNHHLAMGGKLEYNYRAGWRKTSYSPNWYSLKEDWRKVPLPRTAKIKIGYRWLDGNHRHGGIMKTGKCIDQFGSCIAAIGDQVENKDAVFFIGHISAGGLCSLDNTKPFFAKNKNPISRCIESGNYAANYSGLSFVKAVTTLHEAAKLALEALRGSAGSDEISNAREALRSALEAPEHLSSLGSYVNEFATKAGWKPDSGEGAFEYVQRASYKQGLEDASPIPEPGERKALLSRMPQLNYNNHSEEVADLISWANDAADMLAANRPFQPDWVNYK